MEVANGTMDNACRIPQWLNSLVLVRFYKQCKVHDKLPCKYFCIDCMQDAVCTRCNDHHKKHHNHTILEACKASHEATIRICDLKNLWSDVSEITRFKINNHAIVFINTKGGKKRSANSFGATNSFGSGCCALCQYILKEPSTFCSIECYVKYWRSVPQQYNEENAIQVETREEPSQLSSATQTDDEEQQFKESVNATCASELNKSFRKRSRKGVPIRAPTGDFRDNLRFQDFKI